MHTMLGTLTHTRVPLAPKLPPRTLPPRPDTPLAPCPAFHRQPLTSHPHAFPPPSTSSPLTPTHTSPGNPHHSTRPRCRLPPSRAAAPPTADFPTFQELTRRVNACRSLQQLLKYLYSAPPEHAEANTATSALFRAASLWTELQDSPTRRGRDAEEPEVRAWKELQGVLPPAMLEALPALPVDTQIAVAVACAQLGWESTATVALYEEVAQGVVANFDGNVREEMVDVNLMILASAYATAAHYNAQLMEWLGTRVAARLSRTASWKTVATVVHPFIELRYNHPGLTAAVRAWALKQVAVAGQAPVDDDLEGPAWLALMFATFEAGDREVYSALMGALERCPGLQQMNPTTACCLQVLSILLQGSGVLMPRTVAQTMLRVQKEYPEQVVRPCTPAIMDPENVQAALAAGVTLEELQLQHVLMGVEVEETLRLLGLPAARNQEGADGFIALHLVTFYKGREVVVQLCDPECFCSKPYYRFKGTVLNELRALERLGHAVVAVPWFEWARLESDPQRARYLVEGITRALGRPAAGSQ